jgi:hypothetical protein
MLMTKKLDPAAALYREMRAIVEKCRSLSWGSEEWNEHMARYNELVCVWSTARQDCLAEHIKHGHSL